MISTLIITARNWPLYFVTIVVVILFFLFVKYMIFQYPKDKNFNKQQEEKLRKFWENRNISGYHVEEDNGL